jgi:hypothetical protein
MRRTILVWLFLLSLVTAALAWGGQMVVSAESAAYGLNWFSVDSGGGKSINGAYSVQGSVGQPDAGNIGGGAYGLQGGFWGGIEPAAFLRPVYLPLTVR